MLVSNVVVLGCGGFLRDEKFGSGHEDGVTGRVHRRNRHWSSRSPYTQEEVMGAHIKVVPTKILE